MNSTLLLQSKQDTQGAQGYPTISVLFAWELAETRIEYPGILIKYQ